MASKFSLVEYEIDVRRSTPKTQHGDISKGEPTDTSTRKPKRLNLSPLLRPSTATSGRGLLAGQPSPHPWDIPSRMQKAKSIASASTQQLSQAITRLDSSDSRPSSANPFPPYADHIDRKLRASKQSDDEGASSPKRRALVAVHAEDSFFRANRSLIKDIERLRQNINQPVKHEKSWDSRFVYEGSLSHKERAQSASIHRKHDKFVKTMSRFKHTTQPDGRRSPSLMQSASAPLIAIAMSKAESPNGTRPSSPNRLSTPQKDGILFWDDSKPRRPSSPQLTATSRSHALSPSAAEFSEEEVKEMLEAEEVWDRVCEELQSLGNKIIYTDLFEISILRQPHASVIAIVGFVGILMGLKPTWKTVKGILLKEFSIFLNFVREVRSSLLLPFH